MHSDKLSPICTECIKRKCYDSETDEIKVDALKDILRQLDKPYNDVALRGAIDQYNKQFKGREVPLGNKVRIIGLYFKSINSLPQYIGLNWKTGVEFNNKQNTQAANGIVTVIEDKYEPKVRPDKQKFYLEEDESFVVTPEMLKTFGTVYETSEYRELDVHYTMLKEQAASDDIVTDSLIKDLCAIKIQQNRALQSGSIDQYEKLTKLYQSTLSSANLNPKNAKDTKLNDPDECWGILVRNIEKYAPADLYKDDKLFKDFDGIKDYITRFLYRPFKNLFTKQYEKDREFSIDSSDE